jgi:hypothetical protein
MEMNLKNRAPGRPKATETPLQHEEAQPVVIATVVPALICPHCRRGMQPRVLRGQKLGTVARDCACSLCGRCFTYTPPIISLRSEIA